MVIACNASIHPVALCATLLYWYKPSPCNVCVFFVAEVHVYEDPDSTTVVTVSGILEEDSNTGSIWSFPQLPQRHSPKKATVPVAKGKGKAKASGSKGKKAARKKAQGKGPRQKKQTKKGRRK